MASASITRRRTKNGPRYVVRYRLGGRAYPIRHAGSFTRERDARTCRDFVAGELSAGRDPALALRTLTPSYCGRSPTSSRSRSGTAIDSSSHALRIIRCETISTAPAGTPRLPPTPRTISDIAESLCGSPRASTLRRSRLGPAMPRHRCLWTCTPTSLSTRPRTSGGASGVPLTPLDALTVWSRCGLKVTKETSNPPPGSTHHFKKPSGAQC
jgi:hypothetical protein